ncbi:MAG: translocation/assembly module TamB domain-containing protein [Cyanobacteria bacterium P01_A01_bin.123]
MTNSPNGGRNSGRTERPRRRRFWVNTGLTAGAIAILGLAGGIWWGWVFVNNRLSPLVARLLTEFLDRPVEFGDVERVTLSSIRIGPSAIPATDTDPDEVFVESLDVRFNLFRSLFSRKLRLNVEVNGVTGYFEQDADGQWVDVEIDLPERDPDEEGFFQIKAGTIRFSDSEVVLIPYAESETPAESAIPEGTDPTAETGSEEAGSEKLSDVLDNSDGLATGLGTPVTLGAVEGQVSFTDLNLEEELGEGFDIETQQIDLDVTTKPGRGGDLTVKGAFLPIPKPEDDPAGEGSLQANLTVQSQDINIQDIVPLVLSLVPKVPVTITDVEGTLDGNVDITIHPDSPVTLQGTAQVNQAAVAMDLLPQAIEDINGTVRFKDTVLTLEDVVASYGDIDANGGGTLDYMGDYDLAATVDSFSIEQVVDTLDVDLPIPAEGLFTADVTVQGPLAQPEIAGTLESLGNTVIDQVAFADVSLDFAFANAQLIFESFSLIPTAGGSLVGRGQFTLGQPRTLFLQAEGRDLPADAIGRLYGLPETVTLGAVALDAEVSGPLDNLQGLVSWQAPNGDYPARGELALSGQQIDFRNTVVQVAGGLVRGEGTLANGLWNARVQGEGIQLGRFAANLQGSSAGGDVQLSGSLDDLSLGGIRGDGTVFAQIAGGEISGTANLANGLWRSNLQASGVQLNTFAQQLQGAASGDVQLSGSIDDLSLAGIRGEGDLALSQGLASFAGFAPELANVNSPLTAAVAWDGSQIQVQQADTAGISANGVIVPRLSGPGAPTIANLDLNLVVRDYDLAALPAPLPNSIMLRGRGDFTGRLQGSLATLSLDGDAQLTDLAVNDLAFEPQLSGPVAFTLGDRVAIDLTGNSDRLQVNYAFSDRALDFDIRTTAQNVRGETLEAIAIGNTDGDTLYAEIRNFPLSALNLPPDGVGGYGQVRGVVDQADLAINLANPSGLDFVGEVALSDPGLGYIGVDSFSGRITYVNGTAMLTGGNAQRGESQYLLTGRFTPGPDPEIVGQLDVLEGRIQDLLEIFQIFQLSDFARGLNPPPWLDLSPEQIQTILATTPTGDPDETLLNQIRRLSEILVSQRIAEAEVDQAPLPPLSELEGSFTGSVGLNGTLRSGFNVDFDLAGQDWHWGDDFEAEQVTAMGDYSKGILTLRPLRLASANSEQPIVLSAIGDIALFPEGEDRRTLQVTAQNIPIQPIQEIARLPIDISGRLNGRAQLTGNLAEPQIRGSVTVDDATVNQSDVRSARAQFSYNRARFNLLSELLVTEEDEPLTLSASIPYYLPFMEVRPESDAFNASVRVRNEGLALINIFTNQIAWQAGNVAVNAQLVGRWQQAAGIRPEVRIQGSAIFDNATFSLQALSEDLTDIDGTVSFQDDRIVVQDLEGQFSEGRIEARGTFPLLMPLPTPEASDPATEAEIEASEDIFLPDVAADEDTPLLADADPSEPLKVALSQIDLVLEDLYEGQVDGLLTIGGSGFVGPQLSGEIDLSNGQVFLTGSGNGDSENADADVVNGNNGGTNMAAYPIGLLDLALDLDRNIQVIQPGLFTLGAQGTLTLNGTLDDLEPTGRIDITSGRVSLLTTSFRLEGRDNYAQFFPPTGLNPLLNISLRTIVPDTQSGGSDLITSSPFPRNEIPDQDLEVFSLNQGSVGTVRIFAQVEGYASDLASLDGITFTSNPSRSTNEILTLLSGPFIAALESTVTSAGGSGDAFGGLLTLAGSALLTQVQDIVGDVLQLSEFSLFPATPRSAQTSGNALDIGTEIGFDISNSFSVSILQILTNGTPPQFNLRYRVSDQFTVRGTTTYEDFRERSGVILEYETRF